MAHFSRFVPRGSHVAGVTLAERTTGGKVSERFLYCAACVDLVGFVTPERQAVVLLLNKGSKERCITLDTLQEDVSEVDSPSGSALNSTRARYLNVCAPPHSLQTILWSIPYQELRDVSPPKAKASSANSLCGAATLRWDVLFESFVYSTMLVVLVGGCLKLLSHRPTGSGSLL